MSMSSFSDLYSHPGKLLEEHLINVAHIACQNYTVSPVENIYGYNKSILMRLVKICGLCHDIGKATGYFQKYLFTNEDEKKKLKNLNETRHGLLSAVVGFYAAQGEFANENSLTSNEKAFLSFVVFWTIRKHHGNLEDIIDETGVNDKDIELLVDQVKSIDKDKLSILNERLKTEGLAQDITTTSMLEWVKLIQNNLRVMRRSFRKLDREKNMEPYLMTNFIFSLLIDADKSEVVLGEVPQRRQTVMDYTIVDNYKRTLDIKKSKINDLREKAYQEVLGQELDLNKRIYSINLPTGLGKTFISLAFALKLRDSINSKKGYMPRVIYSLPFLSIIEQNADQFERVLSEAGLNVDSDLLLKHHHLSELYYRMGENEFEPDEAKILIEGWNSEIIVTTFVQLFHTLLSNKNSTLRKFHRLSGSIIILDEVQSIPFKFWLLVKNILEELVEKFDSYVVFVTATEPLIFERQDVKHLAIREKYFNALDRVVIKPQLDETITVEELAENIKLEPEKSYLFILNTIKSAKAFYELLKSKTERIGFLSTHVVPKERFNRISEMKEGKIKIAVTTQLVEAGVDIDFDEIYRDLSPLDSINQSAGRCNRNGESQGKVIVVSLKDDRRRYSSYIYDDVLLDITEKILKKHKCIREKDFLNIIDNYYKEMQEKMASDKSCELLSAVYRMKYNSTDEAISISDFKLIDNSYPKIDVFIEIDDDARGVWQDYLGIKEIKDLFERRIAFSNIKADFYKYTVAVPTTVDNLPPEVAGFRYVNMNSLEEFYDKETGFKCQGVTPIW